MERGGVEGLVLGEGDGLEEMSGGGVGYLKRSGGGGVCGGESGGVGST